MNKTITVETIIDKDIATVWDLWIGPKHIEQWAHASDDWECRDAENDVRVGGRFSSTLAAKDGSSSFDFTGVYTEVEEHKLLAYTMDDGRTVRIDFDDTAGGVRVTETFEMEHENTEELQREGWQAMLHNFKAYAEAHVQ